MRKKTMGQPNTDLPAPPPENLARIGEKSFESFVSQGYKIFKSLDPYLKTLGVGSRVLDMGIGVCRVSSQAYLIYCDTLELHGCDVDETAIRYLSEHFPKLNAIATSHYPPLPYPSHYFDLVYSISLWTHFCEQDQHRWLEEVSRVLKPGGIALISIAGETSLKAYQDRSHPLWQGVSWEDVINAGILYRQYSTSTLDTACPGTNRDYGGTLLSIAWVKENFSRYLKIVKTEPAVISRQDLVVLVKEH